MHETNMLTEGWHSVAKLDRFRQCVGDGVQQYHSVLEYGEVWYSGRFHEFVETGGGFDIHHHYH